LAQSALTTTDLFILIGSLFAFLFIATRLWRSRSLKSFLSLLIDFIAVSVLPIATTNWLSSSFGAIERVLLVGLLFYLVNCICYLLFPSRFERYLLPIASVYLVLGTLVSFLVLLTNIDLEFQLNVFVYGLLDNTTVATFCELFMTDLVPVYKHLSFRLNESFGNHAFNMAKRNNSVTAPIDLVPFHPRMKESKLHDPLHSLTKTAFGLLREGKYKMCIESCDTSVGNMIVTTMLQLNPARLEAPLTIEEQISRLESKGVPIPGKMIMKLRSLRNNLTASCSEGTFDQARWAMKVMHMMIKRAKDFRKVMSNDRPQ
jgi:hypothetical protein